jgi:hypothetical protein
MLVSLTFASCKKEEKKSAVDLLTNGSSKTWKLTGARSSSGVVIPPADLVSNIWTFYKDGTIVAVKDGISSSGGWQLTENDTKLGLRGRNSDGTYEEWSYASITKLDEKTLTILDRDGDEATFTAQ